MLTGTQPGNLKLDPLEPGLGHIDSLFQDDPAVHQQAHVHIIAVLRPKVYNRGFYPEPASAALLLLLDLNVAQGELAIVIRSNVYRLELDRGVQLEVLIFGKPTVLLIIRNQVDYSLPCARLERKLLRQLERLTIPGRMIGELGTIGDLPQDQRRIFRELGERRCPV